MALASLLFFPAAGSELSLYPAKGETIATVRGETVRVDPLPQVVELRQRGDRFAPHERVHVALTLGERGLFRPCLFSKKPLRRGVVATGKVRSVRDAGTGTEADFFDSRDNWYVVKDPPAPLHVGERVSLCVHRDGATAGVVPATVKCDDGLKRISAAVIDTHPVFRQEIVIDYHRGIAEKARALFGAE